MHLGVEVRRDLDVRPQRQYGVDSGVSQADVGDPTHRTAPVGHVGVVVQARCVLQLHGDLVAADTEEQARQPEVVECHASTGQQRHHSKDGQLQPNSFTQIHYGPWSNRYGTISGFRAV